MKNRFIQWAVSGLVIATILCLPARIQAQFNPPRIIHVLRALDTGGLPDSLANKVSFYINRGVETNINRGDILNVYRERNLDPSIQRPLRIFIGTMTVTDSQPGSSVGRFLPNEAALSSPLIRYKTPLKNDIVVPRLIIDSEVLFGPGKAALKKRCRDRTGSSRKIYKEFLAVEAGHRGAHGWGW